MAIVWLPKARLADKPTIKTLDDVSLALSELAAIETSTDGQHPITESFRLQTGEAGVREWFAVIAASDC